MTMIAPEEERQRLTKLYSQMSEGELLKVCTEVESLTDVAHQTLRSEFERRGMDTALFDSGNGADTVEYSELAMIRRFRDLPEALLAKTSLESAGIECFLADENIVRIDWFWSNLLGGVKLHVRTEDADAALEILGQPVPEGFEVEGVGQFERPRCPNCNSVDFTLMNSGQMGSSVHTLVYRFRFIATDGHATRAVTSGQRMRMPDAVFQPDLFALLCGLNRHDSRDWFVKKSSR